MSELRDIISQDIFFRIVFISCNSDFITCNYEFISHNTERIFFFIQWWKHTSINNQYIYVTIKQHTYSDLYLLKYTKE